MAKSEEVEVNTPFQEWWMMKAEPNMETGKLCTPEFVKMVADAAWCAGKNSAEDHLDR